MKPSRQNTWKKTFLTTILHACPLSPFSIPDCSSLSSWIHSVVLIVVQEHKSDMLQPLLVPLITVLRLTHWTRDLKEGETGLQKCWHGLKDGECNQDRWWCLCFTQEVRELLVAVSRLTTGRGRKNKKRFQKNMAWADKTTSHLKDLLPLKHGFWRLVMSWKHEFLLHSQVSTLKSINRKIYFDVTTYPQGCCATWK